MRFENGIAIFFGPRPEPDFPDRLDGSIFVGWDELSPDTRAALLADQAILVDPLAAYRSKVEEVPMGRVQTGYAETVNPPDHPYPGRSPLPTDDKAEPFTFKNAFGMLQGEALRPVEQHVHIHVHPEKIGDR
jgi:hypothetical protein